jgi:S-DNA-T family DNA segregation ATPase FtsK/SpoIIIE
MAKKKRKKSSRQVEKTSLLSDLAEGTVRGVVGILLFVLAAVLILAAINHAGPAGAFLYWGLHDKLFGIGYYLIPIILLVLSITCFRSSSPNFRVWSIISSVLLLGSGLGLIDIAMTGEAGIVGSLIAEPLRSVVDVYATTVILLALFLISLFILLDTQIQIDLTPMWNALRARTKAKEPEDEEIPIRESTYLEEENEDDSDDDTDEEGNAEESEESVDVPEPTPMPVAQGAAEKSVDTSGGRFWRPVGTYTPPPVSLLEKDRGKPGVGDTKANANLIKRTLQNFGIQVDMDEITVGPTVTRYALKPAEGVRISKIVSLQSNLELALAASPIRIEAPIPGKSLVGIEVPNTSKTTLGLASLIGNTEFLENKKHLVIALGRDITGVPHFAVVAKMPHGLIAGATGSGKSVTIHDAIISLLYRNGPDMLRMIMIDPKRVELTLYNGIPHLMTPVITDAKKAILALKWAAREMSRRYDILETESVRDITSYHTNVYGPAVEKGGTEETALPEPMPYIVVIIDELADIMQSYPRELEASIVRLAQMSRAVGIHLILSTQRPSVNVITGLIKANVPTRLALQVASQIDSRTILDGSGAEKLLGAGDTLYLSGDMAKPVRLQAPFVTEAEVKNVVAYIKKHNDGIQSGIDLSGNGPSDPNAIFSANLEEEGVDEDEMYVPAKDAVQQAGKASTSFLQRRLGIGYSRAAKLIDLLEARGVVGPADGAKPREVLGAPPASSTEENI